MLPYLIKINSCLNLTKYTCSLKHSTVC